MHYHPGHVETKHQWTKENWTHHPDVDFEKNNDSGFYSEEVFACIAKKDWLHCGSSGVQLVTWDSACFKHGHNPVHNSKPCIGYTGPWYTCGFLYGCDCSALDFPRRWSCCRKSIVGTIADMEGVPGCTRYMPGPD